MKRTIIDRMTNRRTAKKILDLAYATLITAVTAYCALWSNEELRKKEDFYTAKAIIQTEGDKIDRKTINAAALKYLKEHPGVIDDFDERDYDHMDRLREIVLGESNEHIRFSGFESERKIAYRLNRNDLLISSYDSMSRKYWNSNPLYGKTFSSKSKLGWELKYLPSLDRILDKKNKTLYKLNIRESTLEKEIENVYDVFDLSDGQAYIAQEDQLLLKEKGSDKLKTVFTSGDEEYVAKPIRNTPFGILLINEKNVELLGKKEKDPKLWEDLESLIRTGIAKDLFKNMVEQTAKITLTDEYFAVGDGEQIKIMTTDQDHTIRSTHNLRISKYKDFKLADVNDDGKEDLIALMNGGTYSLKGMIYSDWNAVKQQAIINLPINFRFSHKPDEDVKWANPKQLKEEYIIPFN
ncbi:MAG: hypothetical protein L6408_05375, partial [Nanoarchaeota archaeon]|nr:hypothetical protein [Nanoarchaeota archaeon]